MIGGDGVPRSGRRRRSRALVGCLVMAVVAASAAATRVAAVPRSAGLPSAASGSVFGRHIKHVVVFYQENHSFDETLGRFCQDHHGRCDGYTGSVRLKGGKLVAMQPSPDVVPSAPHDVRAQKTDIDGGAMDGWAVLRKCHPSPARYPCLTYYVPSQIPNLAGLAAKFVVSDHTFSMADSPSWGGHVYAAAATQDHFTGDLPVPGRGAKTGPGWGCDSGRVTPWANPETHALSLQPSCIPARPGTLDPKTYPYNGAYRASPVAWVPTIFDRLDAKGLKWKLYSSSTVWSICPSFAECRYGPQHRNLVTPRSILSDAQANRLPAFSILLPDGIGNSSQHNSTSMRVGDNWIGRVLSTIEHSPAWSSTVVFITYDDCGCFYDHVAPGKNPDGTRQGVRVPMIIVSPYAKRSYTESHPATFASILRFTEETFGLAPLSVNDRLAYDYARSFDFATPPSGPRVNLRPRPISTATKAYLATHPADTNDPT